MHNTDPQSIRKRLEAERQELLHDAKTTAEERGVVVLDQTAVGRLSRMDALQNQAMQVETERRREIELKRIEAALKRLDSNDYGFCVSCGEAIQAKRLDMDPATPVCIDCAHKAE
ncbi:TraR/DksA family transcriptional regulator [Magnetovibrio blakemorei]|uniref:Molecular chaperone DnaK n=1 Tax=Magnetovibrio blakemorei TaxID=28181 RepID=A0A1E5Q5U1_9PROT|nr:TraR/DksA family transcriptional regulator [Magnetovibrio blakemorei]OEJ65984.1 molecular chaperone DnaK [Magnetovibrio blakemorei]